MIHSFWKPTLKNFLLVSFTFLTFYLLLFWPHEPFQNLQWRLHDFFMEWAYRIRTLPDPLDEIVIILFDQESNRRLGKTHPWERSLDAQLIDTVTKQNPRVIGLDLFFVGESLREEDDQLTHSLARSKNVLLASYFGVEKKIAPLPRFSEACLGHGFVNKPEDPDFRFRKTRPLIFSTQGDVSDFSFEVKLLAASLDIPFENILFDKNRSKILFLSKKGGLLPFEIPVRKDGALSISYQAKKKDFHTLSAWEVLRGDIPPETFQNKIVLFGIEGTLANDFFLTPFGMMDGIYLVANNFLMFLTQTYLVEMSPLFNIFLFVVLVLLTALLSYQFYGMRSLLALLAELAGVGGMSFLFFLGGFIWNFTNGVFLVLVTYLLISFHKYICAVVENTELKKEAILDENTGLYRYHYFDLRLRQELWRAKRYHKPLSLMVIDIDHYKGLKDLLGKEKAGRLLKEVAEVIQKQLRQSDVTATYGGDEFFSILPHTKMDAAIPLAERIRKSIEGSEFPRQEKLFRLTVSIGIANYPRMPIRSAREFMAVADEALYHAKAAGRNCVAVSEARKGKRKEVGGTI